MCLAASAIFATVFSIPALAADLAKLDEFIASPDVWKTEAESFIPEKSSTPPFVKWLSDKKDAARYPGWGNSPEMSFLGEKVVEAIFRFSDGKLSNIEISLYNRGDAGDLSVDALEKKVEEESGKIAKWSSDKGVQHDRQKLASGKWLSRKAWVKDGTTAVVMLWSTTNHRKVERAEYLKMELSPFDPKQDPRKKSIATTNKPSEMKATAAASDLKKNVKKDDKGNVFIDGIPMVDQGQKGYCAVAVAETVLRYYGSEVDQNMLAQIVDTATKGGTNPDTMFDMLKKTSTKFGVKVREVFGFDQGKFIKLLKEYNSVEKKEKKPKTTFQNWASIAGYYNQMDLDILRQARVKEQKSDYAKFQKTIISSIDEGCPLLWALMLGMVKENPDLLQANGGHMRVVKGYNKEKNEIVYSDTWGAGHEWKTMSMEDAWAVTTGLYTMEPRKK